MAQSSKPAIIVDDLYKSFDRLTVRGGYTTFKTQLVQLFRRGRYKEQLQKQRLEVLRGLSFEIRRGETVGIIGDNGAGKSTLLKLFTGIYKPTTGRVEHNGRVSALLELGAGFHPEFSGRENIYMNGMILGLSRKELRAKEAGIIAFSELEEFIDAPVRTYSSGMYMRLAFAIAVNVDPEILIIDEILAVGDEHFQRKSQARLDQFKTEDTAIVLVTHGLGVVENWCTRAIWLDGGRVAADGDPREVVRRYREATRAKEALAETPRLSHPVVERRSSHGDRVELACRVAVTPRPGETATIQVSLLSAQGAPLCTAPSRSLDANEALTCLLHCPENGATDGPRVLVRAHAPDGRILEERETIVPVALLAGLHPLRWSANWDDSAGTESASSSEPAAVAH